jgi:N-acetylneuraminic acid mutarotase
MRVAGGLQVDLAVVALASLIAVALATGSTAPKTAQATAGLWRARDGSAGAVLASPGTAPGQVNSWTALQVPPFPRSGSLSVWDSTNGQMLIFGGTANGSTFNDVWAYRPGSNSWAQLFPWGGSPSLWTGVAAAWDPTNAQMLVLGGTSPGSLNELWSFRPASGGWAQLTPTGGPHPARTGAAAVWDAANSQMLVFGGVDYRSNLSGTYYNDLWAYRPASNAWVPLTPTGPPPVRAGHSAVWDILNNQMLIFGGHGALPFQSDVYLNDVWAYRPDSDTWVQFTPSGGPPAARSEHSAVWDAVNGRMLVFDGINRTNSVLGMYFDDLWAYQPAGSAGTWTPLAPTGGPPAVRADPTAVWDPTNNQMLAFGGEHNREYYNDVWAYRPISATWVALQLPPVAREQHTTVWDPTNNQMLMFGGHPHASDSLNDLWSYRPASNTWSLLTPASALPPTRYGHTAVWDPTNNQMLVFGGVSLIGGSSTYLNDLWAYQPGSNTWTQLNPASTLPAARYAHMSVWDVAGNRLLVYAGYTSSQYVADLWAYSPGSNSWAQLPTVGFPNVGPGAVAAWDTVNNQLLVFGGRGLGSSYYNELWAYRPASTIWVSLAPSGPLPPGRMVATAVWDSTHSQMLLFGGSAATNLNDLWAYRPYTNAWVQLTPGGSLPTARWEHAAAWDSADGQMLIFAGWSGANFNDLWGRASVRAANTHAHGDGYGDREPHRDGHPHAQPDGNRDPVRDRHTHNQLDANRDAVPGRHEYGDRYGYAKRDAVPTPQRRSAGGARGRPAGAAVGYHDGAGRGVRAGEQPASEHRVHEPL